MRFRTLVLAAAALAAGIFGAWHWRQAYLAAARRAEAWAHQQRIEATEAALETLIEMPDRQLALDELPELFRRNTGISVQLDGSTFRQEPIRTETPLPWIRGRVSVRAALDLLLATSELCYDVEDGRLVVRLSDDSFDLNELRTAVYPLPQPEFATSEMDQDAWAEVIKSVIARLEWFDALGNGHIEVVPGALVIVQCEAVHRQLRRLFEALDELEGLSHAQEPVSMEVTRSRPAQERLERLLARLIDVDVCGEPLVSAVNNLAAEHDLPLAWDLPSLEWPRLPSGEPVTSSVRGQPLGSVLDQWLVPHGLGYSVRDGVLVVTTSAMSEQAWDLCPLRLYRVGDVAQGDPLALVGDVINTNHDFGGWETVGAPTTVREIGPDWLAVVGSIHLHQRLTDLLKERRTGQVQYRELLRRTLAAEMEAITEVQFKTETDALQSNVEPTPR